MSISAYLELSNFSRDQFRVTNHYSDFKRSVSLDFISFATDEIKCEIALTFFQFIVFKSIRLQKSDYSVLSRNKVDLVRVCLPNSGLLNTNDVCIREFETTFDASKSFDDLQYFPISLRRDSTINVQLRDGQGQIIKLPRHMPDYPDNLSYFVLCHFHVRPMSLFDVKCLRLYSADERNKVLFSDNNCYSYKSAVSAFFHDDDDFTGWEVALQSVAISKEMMKHFKDATQMNVKCGRTQFYDTLSDINSQILRSFATPQKLNRRTTTYFEVNTPIYFNVTKRLLDEISIKIVFFNGSRKIILKDSEITDDMYSRVTLLFRRKYMLNNI